MPTKRMSKSNVTLSIQVEITHTNFIDGNVCCCVTRIQRVRRIKNVVAWLPSRNTTSAVKISSGICPRNVPKPRVFTCKVDHTTLTMR